MTPQSQALSLLKTKVADLYTAAAAHGTLYSTVKAQFDTHNDAKLADPAYQVSDPAELSLFGDPEDNTVNGIYGNYSTGTSWSAVGALLEEVEQIIINDLVVGDFNTSDGSDANFNALLTAVESFRAAYDLANTQHDNVVNAWINESVDLYDSLEDNTSISFVQTIWNHMNTWSTDADNSPASLTTNWNDEVYFKLTQPGGEWENQFNLLPELDDALNSWIEVEAAIQANTDAIVDKANQTQVDAIQATIDGQASGADLSVIQSNIDANAAALAEKAAATEVIALSDRVTTLENAAPTDLSGLTSRVTALESATPPDITSITNRITALEANNHTPTDITGLTSRVNALEAVTPPDITGLTSRVTALEAGGTPPAPPTVVEVLSNVWKTIDTASDATTGVTTVTEAMQVPSGCIIKITSTKDNGGGRLEMDQSTQFAASTKLVETDGLWHLTAQYVSA
jgi:predicted RecB family endonuclease